MEEAALALQSMGGMFDIFRSHYFLRTCVGTYSRYRASNYQKGNPHQEWQIADVGNGQVIIINNGTGTLISASNGEKNFFVDQPSTILLRSKNSTEHILQVAKLLSQDRRTRHTKPTHAGPSKHAYTNPTTLSCKASFSLPPLSFSIPILFHTPSYPCLLLSQLQNY